MDKEFNDWWNADSLIEDNPFRKESPAFWAWEGWQAGLKAGMKREHAMWVLAKVGQEIELGISYEEANPPEPYCKRCGKKLGTEAYDVHTCTPIKKEWVGLTKEELAEISEFHFHGAFSGRDVYEDIETRLKEKNT